MGLPMFAVLAFCGPIDRSDIRDFLRQRAIGSRRDPKRVTRLIGMQYSLLRLLVDGKGLQVISRKPLPFYHIAQVRRFVGDSITRPEKDRR